jgi:hypothetical protein
MLANRFSRSVVCLLVGVIVTGAVIGTSASHSAAQTFRVSTIAVGDVTVTHPGSWVVLSRQRSIETMLEELRAKNPTRSRDYVRAMLVNLHGYEGAFAVDAMNGDNVAVVLRGDSFNSKFGGSSRKQCRSLAAEDARNGFATERCTATTVGGQPAYRVDGTFARQYLTASIYFRDPITGKTVAVSVTCDLNAAGRSLVELILAGIRVG